jgi:hypothetical protein
MSWNREGQHVTGCYLGYIVAGTVTESRVKYGGAVQHTVSLDAPAEIFGDVREVVLLDEKELFAKLADDQKCY